MSCVRLFQQMEEWMLSFLFSETSSGLGWGDVNGRTPFSFFFIGLLFYFIFMIFLAAAWLAGPQFPHQGSNSGPLAVRVLSPSHWTAREFPGTTFSITDFLLWQYGQGRGSYPHPASLGLGKLAPLVLPGPPLCPCPVHLVSSDVHIQHIRSP